MSADRVLVVGTTPDYVALIQHRHPQQALFVTDRRLRCASAEQRPAERDEILADLGDTEDVGRRVEEHLARWGVNLVGVTSFDCESLALAAALARALNLPYASPEAVAACRDKFACKHQWRKAGLPCPETIIVRDAGEAIAFRRRIGGAVVLKPLTGSGSELVFLCDSESEIRRGVATILGRLAVHRDRRMYGPTAGGTCPASGADPRQVLAVEEFVRGEEYSADVILEEDRVRLVRIARKFFLRAAPLGTTLAYELPSEPPAPLTRSLLAEQFGRAARSLGLRRALVMVDFIVRGGRALLIEIAPRPGGDCLPPLIRQSCGLDMLGAALDFAAGESIGIPAAEEWSRLLGVRLLARQAGRIVALDESRLAADPRIREHLVTRMVGHQIVLPPEDYDSRILGYAIFAPAGLRPLAAECLEVAALLGVEVQGSGSRSARVPEPSRAAASGASAPVATSPAEGAPLPAAPRGC